MAEAAAPARRPVIVWDLVVTIVLLVLMVGAGLLLGLFGFLFLAFSDSCGASMRCDYDVMTTGVFVAVGGVLLVGLLALVAAVILLVLRRIAFWVPLVGIVLMVAAFWLGASISTSGVQPMSG